MTPFAGYWEEVGEGEPVLCLSGFASALWMLRDLLEPLQNQGRFILPDNRGMGRSPPASAPYRLADLANDALQLLDALQQPTFSVIGLSMGGFVAQWLALAAPERVKRLVLLCTASSGPAFKPLFPLAPRQQVAEIYRLPDRERITAALSPALFPLLASRYPEVYAHAFRQRMAHLEAAEQVLLQYDAVADFLESPLDLGRISCPTLVLAGEEDRLVPLANGQRLAQSIPHARLIVIPDTDHLFFLEKQAEVAAIIARFLRQPGAGLLG
ncbi:MAG: alpha/beta hydrolase [Magnetococcus sp. YQC-3]